MPSANKPLYTSPDLDSFNLHFSIAHRMFGKTPIPVFFRDKGIKYHTMPDFFESDEEVIAFSSTMGKSPDQQILHELILATAEKVNMVREYDKANDIYNGRNDFKNHFFSHFKLTQFGEHLTGKISGHQVMISHRDKTLSSTVHKLNIGIDNETGKGVGDLEMRDILDRLGFTIELISKDFYDALDVMHEIEKFMTSIGASRVRIRTKTVDFQDRIKSSRVQNNPGLYESINEVGYYKKASTSAGYSEVIRPSYIWQGLPIEFKFTLDSGNNQYGLNFTGIYEYWEKYLKGYAGHWLEKDSGILKPTPRQIMLASRHFVRHVDEIIEGNPDKKGTLVESYKKELYTDLVKENYIKSDSPKNDKSLGIGVEKYFSKKAGYKKAA